jgi:hypothetical protein
MNTGDKANQSDLGKNHTLSSYTSKTGERKTGEEMISRHHQSPLQQIKGILGNGQQGIKDAAMSQLGTALRNLSGVTAGAGAGYEMGLEYGKTPNGEHKVSMFLEASAWASLELLGLPAFAVEAGIGGRMVYVKSKRWGIWQPAAPEMYLFGGDLDNYEGNAWELNIRGTEDKPAGDEVDQIIDHLRRMQFTKRFMVTLGTRKLRMYKHRLANYKSLVGSDAQARGATLKAAVTVDVDLGRLKAENGDLRLPFERLQEQGVDLKSNPLKFAKDAIGSAISEGGDSSFLALFQSLITSDSVTQCTLHAEAAYGGALSGKVAGGAKLQIDIAGSVGLVYEKSFSGSEVFEFIELELGGNKSANGDSSGLPLLADAMNSDESAMDEFSTIVMGRGK